MNSTQERFEKAKNLHLMGHYKDAQKIYMELLKKNKDNFVLHNLIGTTFLQLKLYDSAIDHLDISIKLNPNFADSYNNRGIIFAEKNEFIIAINNYNKAISLKKKFFSAYLNKAIALKNIKRFHESVENFKECVNINPKEAKIYINLGNLFILLKKYSEAKDAYDRAIILDNKLAEAYYNRGELFQLYLKDFKLAIKDYEEALKINKNLDFVYGKLIHAKMQINDWENFDQNLKILRKKIINNEKVISPFPLLSLIDEPDLHKRVAIQHSQNIYKNETKKNKTKINIKNKIKIGYFSARLHDSPTLHLMFDVFKNHNKSEFEIYGFSHGDTDDKWTKKIKKYFKKFHNISNLSTHEVLDITKKIDLDVAINLTGHTLHARDDIFFYRTAPIQINYLGYPGTLGSEVYDYIIADKIILPKSAQKDYLEKIIYLPNCYQPNQKIRDISKKNFKKEDFGIPKNSFVLGCFNNSYKITPIFFNCWMRILAKTNNSILWLLQNDLEGRKNILKEASKNGIATERIIFAERVSVEEHLKRIGLIDLFLDTCPYNAHTTATEAIRMGVPVLTLKGKSFASRVASSILVNANLQTLITSSLSEYEKKAIDLINNNKISNLKKHLSNYKNINKLFDSRTFTQDLEKIYKKITI